MSRDNKSTGAAKVAAFAALLALGTSGALAYYAKTNNDRMEQQEEKLNRQEASKVYLGEVPQSYYDEHGHPPTVYAVHNTSGAQVGDVWVQGEKGEVAKLGMVQRCTFYTLTFTPKMMHFRDAYGTWRRGQETPPERDNAPVPGGPHGGTEYTLPIENCSG
jgi:hypothetical protein